MDNSTFGNPKISSGDRPLKTRSLRQCSLKQKSVAADDEDPTQYLENRMKYVEAEMAKGENPYPHKFFVSMSIPEYIGKYGSLSNGEHFEDTQVSLAGRIMSKRSSSSKLFFYDLHGNDVKVQVMADASKSGLDEAEFSKLHANVKRGDCVGVTGFPGKTKRGELTIFPQSFIILSHCLHMLPRKADNVSSNWVPGEPRNPEEYVLKDLVMVNFDNPQYQMGLWDDLLKIVKVRSKILSHIRSVLNRRPNFFEVDLPPLISDGAQDIHTRRISPELYLRQLVVLCDLGDVYKIGKNLTHYPEFTTCELYMSQADYNDVMAMIEGMLSSMAEKLTGSYQIQFHTAENQPIEIDFTPPFRRIDMIEELEKVAKLDIPKDLASIEAKNYLVDACVRLGVTCPPLLTTAQLLDKLVEKFLKETCVNPTFIVNHPAVMRPLAKCHGSNNFLTESFQLFINKRELCIGYSELNDPEVQRQHFAAQFIDEDSKVIAGAFCDALQSNSLQTVGCGLGIEELVALFMDTLVEEN